MTRSPKDNLKLIRDRAFSVVTAKINALENSVNSLSTQVEKNTEEFMTIKKDISREVPGNIVLSDKEILARTFTGIKMSLDPRDISVTPHLALDGIWEEDITIAWLKVLKPESVILDIGANFGYFGAIAAQRVNRAKSKVIFFEANPNLIYYIERTLAINFLVEHSTVENLGIADGPGIAELSILENYIGSSSLHSAKHLDAYLHDKMDIKVGSKVKIQTVSIDDYCADNSIKSVDLIKLDIEGYEEKAYKGMSKIVASSPELILFIEFTGASYKNPKEFYEQMRKDFGNVYRISLDGSLLVPERADYDSLFSDVNDWIMLVFSKKKLLT